MAKAVVLVCAALLTGCGHSEKAQVAPPVKVTVMPVSMTALTADCLFPELWNQRKPRC